MNTDPASQHAISLTAITAPTVSFWAHLNPTLTGVLTVAGLIWYGILFTEKMTHWYRRWKRK